MRKRIITQVQKDTASPDQDWLNMEEVAEVEITSEDAAHPIESACCPVRLRDGVPQSPDSRRSGFSSTTHNGCGGSG